MLLYQGRECTLPSSDSEARARRSRVSRSVREYRGVVMITLRVPTPSDLVTQYRNAGWWDDKGLRSGLELTAHNDGSRIAIVDNAGSWTYAMLRESDERALGALQDAGLEPGDAAH